MESLVLNLGQQPKTSYLISLQVQPLPGRLASKQTVWRYLVSTSEVILL